MRTFENESFLLWSFILVKHLVCAGLDECTCLCVCVSVSMIDDLVKANRLAS